MGRRGRGDLVLYELHVGTFTPGGRSTPPSSTSPASPSLGVTALEVARRRVPGARGWGYDGVYLSAAQSSYGGPEGFQRLVDAAHAAGLAVVLDVVYNYLGASGVKAMEAFGPYFTEKYETFGAGRSTTTTPTAARCASGSCRARRLGPRLPRRWAAARRDPAIFDQGAQPVLRELAERVRAARRST